MLQVVAQVLADQDHLREELPRGVRLLDDLDVQQQQLLHELRVRGEDVADYGDEELRHLFPAEEDRDGFLQRVRFLVLAARLERLLDLRRAHSFVEVHEHRAPALDDGVEGRHDGPGPSPCAPPGALFTVLENSLFSHFICLYLGLFGCVKIVRIILMIVSIATGCGANTFDSLVNPLGANFSKEFLVVVVVIVVAVKLLLSFFK